jgi:hypothetical protein
MDQAHGSCGGPWAAPESGLTATPVGEFLPQVGEKRERARREAVAAVGVLQRSMVSKKNGGRGVDGALFRCGREGGADNALFNSLHTWEGSAWRDSTAEREGGGGSTSG